MNKDSPDKLTPRPAPTLSPPKVVVSTDTVSIRPTTSLTRMSFLRVQKMREIERMYQFKHWNIKKDERGNVKKTKPPRTYYKASRKPEPDLKMITEESGSTASTPRKRISTLDLKSDAESFGTEDGNNNNVSGTYHLEIKGTVNQLDLSGLRMKDKDVILEPPKPRSKCKLNVLKKTKGNHEKVLAGDKHYGTLLRNNV
jgi:hypothetical protein